MSSRNPKHVHKYYKAKLSFGTVWACARPNCTHHMPQHMTDLLPGKNTQCWNCECNTVMDSRTMVMEKPLCEDCDPNTFDIEKTTDILTELGLVNKVTGE